MSDTPSYDEMSNSAIQRVLGYVISERARRAEDDEAIPSLGRVLDTLGYLNLILWDYEEARSAVEAGLAEPGRPMTTPTTADGRNASLLVQLRTETFYAFARILLDQVARAIRGAFGPHDGHISKAPLSGHTELKKNLDAYAKQKGLSPVPDTLRRRVEEVSTAVRDVRDDVVHDAVSKRIKGLLFDRQTGSATPVHTILGATTEADEVTLLTPPELMELIDGYLEEVIDCLTLNRGRSQGALLSAGPGEAAARQEETRGSECAAVTASKASKASMNCERDEAGRNDQERP